MNYQFINKFLSYNFTKFFPRTINRKIFRRYNIFFIPTDKKRLPNNFYPITTNLGLQNQLVYKFNKKKRLINQTTKKNLDKFLFNLYIKKNFSFFDVGGDNIDLYLYLSKKLNIKKYYISNFDEIILIFKKLKTKFNFTNLYPISRFKQPQNVDFVYFGSCIQYFKDYKLYLKKICNSKPKYILFSGTSFYFDNYNHETLVVKQTNILPNLVFLYFFNYKKFVSFLSINGYKLIFKRKNLTNKLNYKNFYPNLKKVDYLDLMFKKI